MNSFKESLLDTIIIPMTIAVTLFIVTSLFTCAHAGGFIGADTTAHNTNKYDYGFMFANGDDDLKLVLRAGILKESETTIAKYDAGFGFYNERTGLILGVNRQMLNDKKSTKVSTDAFYGFLFPINDLTFSIIVVDKAPRIGMGLSFGRKY